MKGAIKMLIKTKIKTIVMATALTTLLSATAAFADTTSSKSVPDPKFSQPQSSMISGWFNNRLDSLVKDDAITLAQRTAIRSAITIANEDAVANGDYKSVDNRGSKYVLDGLVKDGTITLAQEVTIHG